MRIQYEKLLVRIHKMIDDELEIDTEEGRDAFEAMTQALFGVYIQNRKARDHVQANTDRSSGARLRDLARRGPSVVGVVLPPEATRHPRA